MRPIKNHDKSRVSKVVNSLRANKRPLKVIDPLVGRYFVVRSGEISFSKCLVPFFARKSGRGHTSRRESSSLIGPRKGVIDCATLHHTCHPLRNSTIFNAYPPALQSILIVRSRAFNLYRRFVVIAIICAATLRTITRHLPGHSIHRLSTIFPSRDRRFFFLFVSFLPRSFGEVFRESSALNAGA